MHESQVSLNERIICRCRSSRRSPYRYGCLEHAGQDPQAYGFAASFKISRSCEDDVVEQLMELRSVTALTVARHGTARLVAATDYLLTQDQARHLPQGYFGASTGAGAALVAAADRPDKIVAVVSRGGRPDLAGDALPQAKAPTLLIVGYLDTAVIEMNQEAMDQMTCEKKLEIVPGATHLFEEPGTLEQAAILARDWFEHHFQTAHVGR